MDNDLLQQILNKVNSIEEKVESTDIKINSMQSQLEEHGQLLRALEHNTGVIKANQEVLKYDVAEIKGELISVRKDITGIEYITGKHMSDIAQLKSVK